MAIYKGEGNARRITGRVVGDVKFSTVGANETPLTRFGVKCGEGREGEIVNVKCWRGLAEIAKDINNGDSVDVSGFVEQREYEGKTYYDLVADYLNVARKAAPAADPAAPEQLNISDIFTDIGSNDIPF